MKKILLLFTFILTTIISFSQSKMNEKNYRDFEKRKIELFKEIRFGKIDSNAIYIAYHYAQIHTDSSNIDTLVYMLTKNCKNDLEKYRSLSMWISIHINYDYDYNSSNYDWDKNNKWWVVFETGSGVCGGISVLYTELCKRANLFACVGSGSGYLEGRRRSHGWNIIKYEDNYYLIDNTFNKSYKPFCLQFFIINPYEIHIFDYSNMSHTDFFNNNMDNNKEFAGIKLNIFKNMFINNKYNRSLQYSPSYTFDFPKYFFPNIREKYYVEYVYNFDNKFIKKDIKTFLKKKPRV